MPLKFTQQARNRCWQLDNSADALAFLNNPENFRPFSEGLTELIYQCSYSGINDPDEKTSFLYEKFRSIDVPISKSTIKAWFTDKRRPSFSSVSRKRLFQLCFALSASFEDVDWFFHHVYYDRCFNCHTIEEAVYYYCFHNKYTYSHSQELIRRIHDLPEPSDASDLPFTKDIRDRIGHYQTDEEMIRFFSRYKNIFHQQNKRAAHYIHFYLSEIQGKPSDKELVKKMKKGLPVPQTKSNCGLIIQEQFKYKDSNSIDEISGKNITSIDFMLDCIFGTTGRMNKETQLPDIVCKNFPSKKTFSNILKKIDFSTSYDSIRKCLILLKFYHFWCKDDLRSTKNSKDDFDSRLFELYCDETNALLNDCCYGELYVGNPYDWLFLWASASERPLDFFRDLIAELTDDFF